MECPPNAKDLFVFRDEIVCPELRRVWGVPEDVVKLISTPRDGIRTVRLFTPEFSALRHGHVA